jgi:hypothetical protein
MRATRINRLADMFGFINRRPPTNNYQLQLSPVVAVHLL